MKEYTVVNILDMLEAIGEENLSVILSDFSCPINKEIENFVWHNAIEFAKKKMSITYFLMDAEGEMRIDRSFWDFTRMTKIGLRFLESGIRCGSDKVRSIVEIVLGSRVDIS